MSDKNKSDENEAGKITDRRMNIEIWLIIILCLAALLTPLCLGDYLTIKSRGGIWVALIGLSGITSANAWAAAMNYSLPDFLSSIKFGPWYSRIIGAIIVLFSVLKIFT